MVTEDEKERLVKAYQRLPVSVAGLLLTCAAGLIVVVALALIAIDIHTYSDADRTTQVAKRAP